MKVALAIAAASAACVLSACSTAPSSPPPAALTTVSPEAMITAIRAAAGNDDSEFAVQPLRDPMVEDLRDRALQLEAARRYDEAAAALDKALAINGMDPALLQERAEAALLLKQYPQAEQLARRAYEIGAKLGPLCRRHWATVQQTRLQAGDASGAASAQARIDGCKVAGPNRF